MNGYEALRIAIILQLKTDYFKDMIDNKTLWYEIHTPWIRNLLGDIDPDKAYAALVRRKLKYESLSKN